MEIDRDTLRYDHAQRRKSRRSGREKGVHIYIAAAELRKAGIDPDAPPPDYKVWGGKKADGGLTVRLYREKTI